MSIGVQATFYFCFAISTVNAFDRSVDIFYYSNKCREKPGNIDLVPLCEARFYVILYTARD